jgi:hypothetical protein
MTPTKDPIAAGLSVTDDELRDLLVGRRKLVTVVARVDFDDLDAQSPAFVVPPR